MKTHDSSEHETLRDYVSDGTPAGVFARYASLPAAAAAADFGDLDRNIVVIDTETTGFSLNHDELTQIAAARMERGEVTGWFITFVNPGKPIPEDVAHLTDIHDEDVADAPTPEDALAQLVSFVGDAKLVAHNAEFDRNFTTKHPSGYPLLENTWIDSLDLARIALPRMKSHRLLDLVRAFGLPPSTHRADADVAATCSLFRILLAAVDAMPSPLVREIYTYIYWPTSGPRPWCSSTSRARMPPAAHMLFPLIAKLRPRVRTVLRPPSGLQVQANMRPRTILQSPPGFRLAIPPPLRRPPPLPRSAPSRCRRCARRGWAPSSTRRNPMPTRWRPIRRRGFRFPRPRKWLRPSTPKGWWASCIPTSSRAGSRP